MNNIQDLAQEIVSYFTIKTRENGKTFICCVTNTPGYVSKLIMNCHDDTLPDNFKYKCIYEFLLALSEDQHPEDIENYIEPDVYNSDLLAWLSSHAYRTDYVNRAVNEICNSMDGNFDIMKTIGQGQWLEKCEILHALIAELEYILKKKKKRNK